MLASTRNFSINLHHSFHTFSFWRVRRCVWYSLSFLSVKSCSSRVKELIKELLRVLYPEISPLIFSICAFISANCFILSSFFVLRSSTNGVTDASFSFNDGAFFSVWVWKIYDNKSQLSKFSPTEMCSILKLITPYLEKVFKRYSFNTNNSTGIVTRGELCQLANRI